MQNAHGEHSAQILTWVKGLLIFKTFFFLSSLSGRLRQVLLYFVLMLYVLENNFLVMLDMISCLPGLYQ